MFDPQASQRLDEIEMMICDKHPDPKGFISQLKLKYGTDEERAAAAKAAADAAKK